MSHLIETYAVCKFSYFRLWYTVPVISISTYHGAKTVSDSNCETQDSRYDFRTVFVTPKDSVCEVKTNISTKEAEIVCKKVYNSYVTDIVLSHAFPSALLCERCFLRIWCVAKYILVDRKTTNFVENK